MIVTAEIFVDTNAATLSPRKHELAIAAILHNASAAGMKVNRFWDPQSRAEKIEITGPSELFESVPLLADLNPGAKQLPAAAAC